MARSAALCALAISVTALVLGIAGVTEPIRFPVLYPMRHTTAIGIGTLAIALLSILRYELGLARITASIATVVAVLALAGQAYRWTRPETAPQSQIPEIINLVLTAFPNALCFFIAGTALLVLSSEKASVHRAVWASIAGSVTLTLSACSLLNEILKIMPANPAFEGEVAVDATLSLTLVGWALIRVAHMRAAEAGDKIEVRRPAMVAVLGTMAAFAMWRSLLEERSSMVAYQTQNATSGTVRALTSELSRRLSEVRFSADEPAPSLLEETGLPRQGNIIWTDLQTIRSSTSPEFAKLKSVLRGRREEHGAFYAVYSENGTAPHVLFAAPRKSGSLRIAVVALHDIVEPVVENVVGENFQLFLVRGGNQVYRFPDPPWASETSGSAVLAIEELDAVVRLQPRSQFVRRGATWASHMVLAIGLNASFLLAFSAYLLHVARARLDEVQRIRSGLEQEVGQRRQTQLELALKAKQLESSNADLREFAHVTSHDLQEPLRSISGFAQLLARRYKGKFDEDADEFLDYITESSTRMSGMIQGLLTYSRVVHAADLDEEVPLQDAVEWAKSNLLLAIEESEARIEVGELPVARGNRLQFGQLMQNLIGNAIKYRCPEPLVIRVTSEIEGSERVVTVADNGLGIGPEFQERIFGLFKRAHGKDYAGAGVGLALCKKIVERHGGRIWVESKPGEGARFRFTVRGEARQDS